MLKAGWNQRDKILQKNRSPTEKDDRNLQIPQVLLVLKATIDSLREQAHFPDVKQSWKNSDSVGTCVVFDISHNKCRLVAWINYRNKKVFVRHVLSHADYDKEKWKDDCDCD